MRWTDRLNGCLNLCLRSLDCSFLMQLNFMVTLKWWFAVLGWFWCFGFFFWTLFIFDSFFFLLAGEIAVSIFWATKWSAEQLLAHVLSAARSQNLNGCVHMSAWWHWRNGKENYGLLFFKSCTAEKTKLLQVFIGLTWVQLDFHSGRCLGEPS